MHPIAESSVSFTAVLRVSFHADQSTYVHVVYNVFKCDEHYTNDQGCFVIFIDVKSNCPFQLPIRDFDRVSRIGFFLGLIAKSVLLPAEEARRSQNRRFCSLFEIVRNIIL